MGISELPSWAQLLIITVAGMAWVEARVMSRRECVMRHNEVEKQLKARHEAIGELRNALQPVVVEVGKLSAITRDLHEDVREMLRKGRED